VLTAIASLDEVSVTIVIKRHHSVWFVVPTEFRSFGPLTLLVVRQQVLHWRWDATVVIEVPRCHDLAFVGKLSVCPFAGFLACCVVNRGAGQPIL